MRSPRPDPEDSRLYKTLNRLTKWRAVFAGWQLGSRPNHDPECEAVRDHREATLLLRVEVSALVALLLQRRVFSISEWEKQLMAEADALNEALEGRFPGFQTTDDGMMMDFRVNTTTDGWKH